MVVGIALLFTSCFLLLYFFGSSDKSKTIGFNESGYVLTSERDDLERNTPDSTSSSQTEGLFEVAGTIQKKNDTSIVVSVESPQFLAEGTVRELLIAITPQTLIRKEGVLKDELAYQREVEVFRETAPEIDSSHLEDVSSRAPSPRHIITTDVSELEVGQFVIVFSDTDLMGNSDVIASEILVSAQ